MGEPTMFDRFRSWLSGVLIAIGERLGGVYEECGVLSRNGSDYCAMPVGHDGLHGFEPQEGER